MLSVHSKFFAMSSVNLEIRVSNVEQSGVLVLSDIDFALYVCVTYEENGPVSRVGNTPLIGQAFSCVSSPSECFTLIGLADPSSGSVPVKRPSGISENL